MPKWWILIIGVQSGLFTQELQKITDDILSLQPERAFTVENQSIIRGGASIDFVNGSMHLLSNIGGKLHSMVFIGEGVLRIIPATAVEREHVQRIYGVQYIQKYFTSAWILYGDSSDAEVTPLLTSSATSDDNDARKLIAQYLLYILDKDKKVLSSDHSFILERLVNGEPFFFGAFGSSGRVDQWSRGKGSDDPIFLKVDPKASESVQILRRGSDIDFRLELISSYENRVGTDRTFLMLTKSSGTRLTDCTADVHLDDKARINGVCDVGIVFSQAGIRCVAFRLFYKLRVDSVLVNGQKAEFLKPFEDSKLWDDSWDRGVLWVIVPSSVQILDRHRITIHYHGEIFERIDDDFYMRASTTWLPVLHNDYKQKIPYELTFNYPSTFRVVSVGDRLWEKKSGRSSISKWRLSQPSRNVSFGFGFFSTHNAEHSNIPPLTVYIDEKASSGLFGGKSYKEQVSDELANSIGFFQSLYGPLHQSSLSAVEIPYGHGEAFPGLIHLPWWTMRGSDDSGELELFRAHEVAHQWWGVGVDYASYHDQWLSEAFAEYSALWYVQYILNDNERFFGFLENYRQRILSNRKSLMDRLLGLDQEAGPIWLGYRTSSRSSRGDYDLIIYEKGAWVLHMLRNLMLDLNTMDDTRFRTMMSDFYMTYSGKMATTNDFRLIAEKHIGADMSWFFNQWIYGVNIPDYTVRSKTEPIADGTNPGMVKYQVSLRISQKNVDSNFQMYVPIQVDLGNNRFVRFRLHLNQAENTIVLPLLPLPPKTIQFNYLQSVLCEYKEAPWQ